MGNDHGPYESEDEARMTPAVRAVHEAYRDAEGSLSGTPLILAACEAAGVELGAYDARIAAWAGNWEPHVCAVFAGLIMRAWDGGSPLAHCRHCGTGIRPCGHARDMLPDTVCKGWRHEGREDHPIGAHYCQGRSVNPPAEPVTREAGGS